MVARPFEAFLPSLGRLFPLEQTSHPVFAWTARRQGGVTGPFFRAKNCLTGEDGRGSLAFVR